VKTLVKIVVVLIMLLVLAAVVGIMAIDSIAKTGIEKGATYALGVPTTLTSADVGIRAGTFDMKGLHVANPTGYTGEFLGLGEGSVAVSLGTLREDVVRLPHLRLTTLDMSLEKKDGKANYDVILANIKRLESPDAPAEPDPNAKRFIVDEVTITDVSVMINLLPIGGDLAKTQIDIPQIKLQGVGSETGNGVLLRELAPIIIKALMAAIIEKGGDLLPAEMLGDLQSKLAGLQSLGDLGIGVLAGSGGALEQITGGLGGVTKDLEGAAKDVGKSAGDAVKGIGNEINKGLGGLLGGDKDKKKKDGD
jgi:hypothetical protein